MNVGGGVAAALTTTALAALALGAAGAPVVAQSLEARIESAADGDVAFQVATRDGVEICDDGDILRDTLRWVRRSDRRSRWSRCGPGPIRIVIERDGSGRATDLDLEPVAAAFAGIDLGEVSGAEAGPYLVERAWDTGLRTRAMERSLMASTLVRDYDAAPALLGVVQDRSVRDDVRKSALFWVAREASERIGPHLAGIAADEAEDQEVRDAAVFALSRRPDAEAVPILMDLARTAPHAGTRRSALFWLARFDDPRVPDFFADLILRGG